MDPVLAQIYGTNSEASDLEKLAADEMAEELASDGYDVGNASDDEIEMMAQAVLNDIQADEGEYSESDVDDETMAKVAEADKLGRVMAHSMWQELGHIKEAGSVSDAMSALKRGAKAIPGILSGREARQGGKAYYRLGKAQKAMAEAHATRPGGLMHPARHSRATERLEAARESAKGHLARGAAKTLGAYGVLGGAGAAAASAMGGKKKKHSSALETLQEARALEILEANGIDPSELEAVYEKTASDPAEELSMAVEQGAWDILAQYGFEPAE